jgi:hypothetical protein
LHRHQIVDDQTLQSRNRRRDKALEIVNEAGGRPAAAPAGANTHGHGPAKKAANK